MDLRPGSRLGSYEIVSPLGAGGMGEVYRARTHLERQVAIKVLPSALSNDPDRLKRFEREARAASGLNHPSIVTIYDFGSEGSASYIAMELVEGSTLRSSSIPGASGAEDPGDRLPARERSGAGSRGGDRPPGPEAGERHAPDRRVREDTGLRPREADSPGVDQRIDGYGDGLGRDRCGCRDGDGRIHVPGAGERAADRLSLRPVRSRGDALRDCDRTKGVRKGNSRRDPASRSSGRSPSRSRQSTRGFPRLCAGSWRGVCPRIRRSATPRRPILRRSCARSWSGSRK